MSGGLYGDQRTIRPARIVGSLVSGQLPSTVVYTGTNQTVSGTKTFSSVLTFAAATGAKIELYSGAGYGFGIQAFTFEMYVPNTSAIFNIGVGSTGGITQWLGVTTNGLTTPGDIQCKTATKGLVLKDTQGTPHYWRVTVSNVGALVVTDLGTTAPV